MLTAGGKGRPEAVTAKSLDFGLATLAAHGEGAVMGGSARSRTRRPWPMAFASQCL
jgi:hypothetical protein